jgi:hypothetical protein
MPMHKNLKCILEVNVVIKILNFKKTQDCGKQKLLETICADYKNNRWKFNETETSNFQVRTLRISVEIKYEL